MKTPKDIENWISDFISTSAIASVIEEREIFCEHSFQSGGRQQYAAVTAYIQPSEDFSISTDEKNIEKINLTQAKHGVISTLLFEFPHPVLKCKITLRDFQESDREHWTTGPMDYYSVSKKATEKLMEKNFAWPELV